MNPTCPSLSVSHQDAVEACHRGFNQWFTNHLVHLTTQEDTWWYKNTSFRSPGKSPQFCGWESFKKYILLRVTWPQLATTRVLCRLLRTFEIDFKIYIARVASGFSRARLRASFGLDMGAHSGCAGFFAAPYACQHEKSTTSLRSSVQQHWGCKRITYYQASSHKCGMTSNIIPYT